MNIKTTLKSSVAAAALFAIAAPVAPSVNAADDTLSSGNKNSLKMSGYIARSIWYGDNGTDSQVFQSDGVGPGAESRVRWVAKGTLNETVTAGATIEMELPLSNKESTQELNNGVSVSSQAIETTTSTVWGVRHHFVWVNHKRMGKISLGHTNAASNGRSETTFSGVNMMNASNGVTYGSGLNFVDVTVATAPTVSGVTTTAATSNFDGLSRTDVLRYDTPRFGGLALATSYTGDSSWDIAADYRAKYGGVKMRLQAQHNNSNSGGTGPGLAGSTSMSVAGLHDSGLNGTFAYGQQWLNGEALSGGNSQRAGGDGKFYYFNVGYRAKLFSVGSTNFSFGWNMSDDINGANDEGEAKGVTIAQMLTPIGASMAVTYKTYSYDTPLATFDDIDVIALQTIFNF